MASRSFALSLSFFFFFLGGETGGRQDGSEGRRPGPWEYSSGTEERVPRASPLVHAELCDAFQLQGPFLDLFVGLHGSRPQFGG